MPIFELEANGKAYEIDAPDQAQALAAFEGLSAPQQPQGIGEQLAAPFKRAAASTAETWRETANMSPADIPAELAQGAANIPGDFWRNQQNAAGSSLDLLKEGVQEVGQNFLEGNALPGIGKAALGGLGYVTSPITSALQTFVGDPLEKSAAIPREYSELAAGFAIPGPKGGPSSTPALTEGQRAAQSARDLGVQVPRAVTSDSSLVRQTGNVVGNVPFAGQVRKANETAVEQLGAVKDATASSYGRGGTASPEAAGGALRSGIERQISQRSSEADVGRPLSELGYSGRVARAYDAVDAEVDATRTAPLTTTLQKAREILARREASGIEDPSPAVKKITGAVSRPEGLTYEGTKGLRTYVGEMLDGGNLPADISQAELKQIYGALTDDLRSNVAANGSPKALALFDRANGYARGVAERRESLNRILKVDSDEKALTKILTAAKGKSRGDFQLLAQARKALSQEEWGDVSSAILNQMGKAKDEVFSPQRFLSDWGDLSEPAKAQLFKAAGRADQAKAIDDIVNVSKRFREYAKYGNPSGTAQNVVGAAGLVTIGNVALGIEPLTSLASLAGANVVSRTLATPAGAASGAKWVKAYDAASRSPVPKNIAALSTATKNLSATLGERIDFPGLMRPFQTTQPAYAGENEQQAPRDVNRQE